jgi:hypothetical protein
VSKWTILKRNRKRKRKKSGFTSALSDSDEFLNVIENLGSNTKQGIPLNA